MIILHTIGTALIEVAPEHSAERRSKTTRITPRAPMRFALLLYLAVERGLPISRESLASLLLGPNAAGGTYHLLRQMLFELRKLGVPIPRDQREILIPPDQVACDFDRLLYAPAAPAELVRAAVNGFLPGFSPRSEAYREWFDPFYATRSAAISRRLGDEAKAAVREGQWDVAEAAARGCLAVDDLNESANFALAQMLAVNGSKAQAVQLLDRYIERIGAYSPQLTAAALGLREKLGGPVPMRPRASRTANGVAVHETAFVGRSAELAQLQDAFETACYGTPQCVIVTGDPGIGKTRLAAEFSATLGVRRAQCARVGLQQHDADRPMGAFVDLVPTLLELRGALGCSPESLYALKKLTTQRTSEAAEDAESAEQHERRWRTVSRAVVELCHSIAFELPLLIEVDDAHWLDSLSATTFGRLVMSKQPSRIVVVATTRDARKLTDEMRAGGRCRMLSLGPLNAAASGALLDSLLAAPTTNRSNLRSRIASTSAGNPLFLVSLATHSRASDGTFQIPATIVESLAQRIDRLSRPGLIVLATCAELGKHSTMHRLSRALELRRLELVEALLELTASGLLLSREQTTVPAHPLVSEALRIHLPPSVRHAVAHGAATMLEEDAESGDSPGLWWDAAQSWKTADNAERAIHALRQCARHALDIGRPGEAARILRDAAELRQSSASLVQVSEDLIRAANAASEFTIVVRGAELRRAATGQERHDDLEMAELQALFALYHRDQDVATRLTECLKSPTASPSHRVEAAIVLLKSADMMSRPDLRSIAVDGIAAADLSVVGTTLKLEYDILVASASGDRALAASLARELLARCAEVGAEMQVPLRHQQAAVIALHLSGATLEAIDAYERLFVVAQQRQSYRTCQFAAAQLSSLHWDIRSDAEAQTWLQRAIAALEDHPDTALDLELLTTRMEIALVRESIDDVGRLVAHPGVGDLVNNEVGRRWIRAVSLWIDVRRGEDRERCLAIAMTISHDRLESMTGVRDFEIAIAADTLLYQRESDQAAAVLGDYLVNERTDLRPPTRLLVRTIEAIRSVTSVPGLGLQSEVQIKGTAPDRATTELPAVQIETR